MRLLTKSAVALATILAASFGHMNLTQAAPLAGAAAAPAVQMTQQPTWGALVEKAHHKGTVHHKKGQHYYHHHYHHHYHHEHHEM